MLFEVFIFSTLVGNVLSGILRLQYLARARDPSAPQKSSRKLALPNRESAIDFRAIFTRSAGGAGNNLSSHEITSHAGSKSSSSRSVSSNTFTFRYLRRNFSPTGCGGEKKLILSNRMPSVVRYNGLARTSHSIYPRSGTYENISGRALSARAHSHFNHPRRKQSRDKNRRSRINRSSGA